MAHPPGAPQSQLVGAAGISLAGPRRTAWGRRRIADIRPTEVQKWVCRNETLAHRPWLTRKRCSQAFWTMRWPTAVLATNPARGVKLPRKTPKARNYLTAAQASALADESKHPDIVLLLATTGLRWGEMAALRVRDIDLGRGRIRVERSASKVNSKTDHRHHQDARSPLGGGVGVGAQAVGPGDGRQVPRRTVVVPGRWAAVATANHNALVRRGGQALPGGR